MFNGRSAPQGSAVVEIVIVVRDFGRVAGADRFEAVLAEYPALAERGATMWEAVRRLVAGHRSLLERRWSEVGVAR